MELTLLIYHFVGPDSMWPKQMHHTIFFLNTCHVSMHSIEAAALLTLYILYFKISRLRHYTYKLLIFNILKSRSIFPDKLDKTKDRLCP